MTDPYPEARRRARFDRGEPADRRDRHRRGPSPRRISKALERIASHDLPGTPPVSTLDVLRGIHDSEWDVDERSVRDFSITRGDPQHGALRSDDHVGRYEVEAPLDHFEDTDGRLDVPDTCPECGHDRALYRYNAHHHIAGSESVFCLKCEEKLAGLSWD